MVNEELLRAFVLTGDLIRVALPPYDQAKQAGPEGMRKVRRMTWAGSAAWRPAAPALAKCALLGALRLCPGWRCLERSTFLCSRPCAQIAPTMQSARDRLQSALKEELDVLALWTRAGTADFLGACEELCESEEGFGGLQQRWEVGGCLARAYLCTVCSRSGMGGAFLLSKPCYQCPRL